MHKRDQLKQIMQKLDEAHEENQKCHKVIIAVTHKHKNGKKKVKLW